MIEDEVKIKDLANNQEIKDVAMNATFEAFPEEASSIILDENFNTQMQEAPMLILVYASAVKAYARNHERTEPIKKFPDLIQLLKENSERGIYFRAQVDSANKEYTMEKDLGGGAGIERLLRNINNGYNNRIAVHTSLIANYDLQWQETPVKQMTFEEFEKRKKATLPTLADLNNRLTAMAAENYGEVMGDKDSHFDELMREPALTIAITEYMRIFKHQKPQEQIPSIEEMKNNQNIQNLAEQINIIGKSAETYDTLPMFLGIVREDPQNFFTKEGFINTEEFDKQKEEADQQKDPTIPPNFPPSNSRGE